MAMMTKLPKPMPIKSPVIKGNAYPGVKAKSGSK